MFSIINLFIFVSRRDIVVEEGNWSNFVRIPGCSFHWSQRICSFVCYQGYCSQSQTASGKLHGLSEIEERVDLKTRGDKEGWRQ